MRHIKRAFKGKEGSEEVGEVVLMREMGWTPHDIDNMTEDDYVRTSRILEMMHSDEGEVNNVYR